MSEKQNREIDPTKNVIELVEASIKRLDDLAELREKYIYEKIKDADVKYQIQFTAAKEAVAIASTAQEKLVAQALDGTKEAINKADINTEKRNSLLSEKIDGVIGTINKTSGERGIYVTHTDLNIAMDKLQAGIEATLRPVVTFMNSQTGRSGGLHAGWVYLLGGVSLISTLIAIFMALSR